MGTDAGLFVGLDEVEVAARAVLPAAVHDFVAGGAGSELTLARNRSALDDVHLVPRVFVDVSDVRPGTRLFDAPARLPVAIAPMAYQRLLHPDGELAAARAASHAGVPFTVSMLSSYSVEDVAQVGGALWFQLYWLRDRRRTQELIARAEDAGCQAIMLTADVPRMGRRRRDIRNGFRLSPDIVAAHLGDGEASRAHVGRAGTSAVATHTDDLFDPHLAWSDLEWMRKRTSLPLLVKGILHPKDATRCADAGADGVIVSNHGGRQLDGAVASIEALPAIAEAVGDRIEVLFDGGIRGGLDVLKAVALGAGAVLLGRPVLWGLAVGGEAGVGIVMSLLAQELDSAMALAGCVDLIGVQALLTGTQGRSFWFGPAGTDRGRT